MASQILFYAVFALGLNVLVGYAGLVSLGHAGLFGVSAYAAGYMLQLGSAIAAIVAALSMGLASMAVYAVLSLRSTGIGFIMITLALGEILWGLAYRWISLTGGDNGINVRTRPLAVRLPHVGRDHFYYVTLIIFVLRSRLMLVFVRFAVRRRAARYARPAAPHERARLPRLGDPLLRLPVLRAAHRRAGILFVYYTQFISPQTLALTSSAEVLLMVISGGPGTLLGPIVGAGLVVVVKNVVSAFIERWNFLLGAIFVAIVILMPEGLVPGSVRLWRLAWRHERQPVRRRTSLGPPHERAHHQRPMQIVRRPACNHRRQSRMSSQANGG